MSGVGVFKADGLRAARNRRGMMLKVMCDRAEVARGTAYAAEAGRPVHLGILVRLARALDVSLAEISSDAAEALEAVA